MAKNQKEVESILFRVDLNTKDFEASAKRLQKEIDNVTNAKRYKFKTLEEAQKVLETYQKQAKAVKNLERELRKGFRTGILIAQERKRAATASKYDSFFGILGMQHQEWANLYKEGGTKYLKTFGGRVANAMRFATEGMRGFRMELLAVMFAGMGINRFFGKWTKGADQFVGATEVMDNALSFMVFRATSGLKLWELRMAASMYSWPKWAQSVVGWGIEIGSTVGKVLQTLGSIGLGIGGLTQLWSTMKKIKDMKLFSNILDKINSLKTLSDKGYITFPQTFIDKIKEAGKFLKDKILDKMKPTLKAVWSGVSGAFKGAVEAASEFFTSYIINPAKNVIFKASEVFTNLKTKVTDALDLVFGAGKGKYALAAAGAGLAIYSAIQIAKVDTEKGFDIKQELLNSLGLYSGLRIAGVGGKYAFWLTVGLEIDKFIATKRGTISAFALIQSLAENFANTMIRSFIAGLQHMYNYLTNMSPLAAIYNLITGGPNKVMSGYNKYMEKYHNISGTAMEGYKNDANSFFNNLDKFLYPSHNTNTGVLNPNRNVIRHTASTTHTNISQNNVIYNTNHFNITKDVDVNEVAKKLNVDVWGSYISRL